MSSIISYTKAKIAGMLEERMFSRLAVLKGSVDLPSSLTVSGIVAFLALMWRRVPPRGPTEGDLELSMIDSGSVDSTGGDEGVYWEPGYWYIRP